MKAADRLNPLDLYLCLVGDIISVSSAGKLFTFNTFLEQKAYLQGLAFFVGPIEDEEQSRKSFWKAAFVRTLDLDLRRGNYPRYSVNVTSR